MKTVSWRPLWTTIVPAVFVLMIVAVVRMRFGITTASMTGDVTELGNLHPLAGFVSNLGVLMWCTSAVACAFAAALVSIAERGRTFWFLSGSALLSGYLLFDDLFRIHDDLAARYLGAGEIVVFAALAVGVAAYFIVFGRDIRRTHYGMLLFALGLLATSVVLDSFVVDRFASGSGLYFLEDGAKWLGVACWCSYYVRTAYHFALSAVRHSGPVFSGSRLATAGSDLGTVLVREP